MPGLIVLRYFDIQQCVENFDHLFSGVIDELIESLDVEKCELVGSVAAERFVRKHVLEK